MPGNLDFGNNRYAARRSVRNDFSDVVLRVEIRAVRLLVGIDPARSADAPPFGDIPHRRPFRQFRVAANLDAPSLMVGKMPVEHIVILVRHPVEKSNDGVLAKEVPRLIQHQPPPAERFATRIRRSEKT